MVAIIYILHGSRVTAGKEQAVNFIKSLIKYNAAPIQEYCFLELAEPTIEEAFIRAVNQGADKIVAIPVLLLTAAHAKRDIPMELARMAERYPELEIIYGKPIGVHPKMVEALMDRLNETGERVTDNSMVLLVGRGSSDPDVKKDLLLIAGMLKEKGRVKRVDACFLTAADPSFEEGLEAAGKGGYDKVFIIPYILFTGKLMNRINVVIETHPYRHKYILCNCLGYHPFIEEVLLERLNELER